MVKLQLDLSKEEDKTVLLHKVKNNLKTKEAAIKEIINSNKVCNHKFERLGERKSKISSVIIQRCTNCGIIRKDKIIYAGPIETTFSDK